jgi:hypothetical protein
MFNGLSLNLGNLAELSNAATRSISAENVTGAKGKGGMATNGSGAIAGRELGQGWKINPCLSLPGKSTTILADIDGPGAIQHIWITVFPTRWRSLVLRMYWDGEETPSVETPLGDFFCNGWGVRCNITSLPVGGFNSFWSMPFRQHARITVENLSPDALDGFFFQITYALAEVPETLGYFHAQWRRSNPLPTMQVHTILDGVHGQGQYVGTYLAMGLNGSNGWWGEGEIKFYLDGDRDFPTICGTGTEDYFGGAWDFEQPQGQYCAFSAPFQGLPQVIQPDGLYVSQQRFGMYRWHIMDPIRFQRDVRVTIQDLGWRSALEGKGRYLPRQDDMSSVAYWYQREPHGEFPALGSLNDLEVI